MAHAYRYHRFSSKAQDKGSSIERQDEATLAMCRRRSWPVAETLEDKGRSAWKGDHLRVGELGKFKQRVEAGDIAPGSILVIENLDRLSRQDVKRARRWIEEVTEAGINVAVCSLDKVFDEASLSGENIIDLLQYLLEAQRSTKESERKSELLKAAWTRNRQRAKQGRIITRRCPGWLRVNGDGFEVVEERAEVVRQIYAWSADGIGAYTIAKTLNMSNIPCWGLNCTKRAAEQWKHGYVRDLLRSPAVEGEYHPRTISGPTGERIEGYYPRIVDADLVARARAARLRRKRTGGPTHSEARNLFVGRVRCHHCGDAMLRTVQGSKGKQYEYFRCIGYQNGTACPNRTVYRYDLFERAALEQMLHLALDDTYFRRTDETASSAVRLAEAEKAVENKRAEQQRLVRVLARVDDAPEIEAELASIRGELHQLEEQRDRLSDALERARGAVSPEEHLQRVMEVRDAIYSPDGTIRDAARRRVRDAVQSIVTLVECRKDDPYGGEPGKTLTMILAGGYAAYKFDNAGKLLGTISLHNQPALQRGITGTGGEQAMQDIKRRQAA